MASREGTFDYLAIAEVVSQSSEWKEALDEVVATIHSSFIFDNLALFLAEQEASRLTEIVYARAVGRGQSAGADTAWGADIATQVIEKNAVVLQEPDKAQLKGDRLGEVYLLGLPLRTSTGLYGAMVFIRFGGPSYLEGHILQARYLASQMAGLFERKKLIEDIRALEEARRLLALQEDFIATISHELRTPLGFIKGYSTTLLRQDTEWDEPTRREFLTIIEEEADHLTVLIENILESARLQSNTLPMKFQPARLDMLIVETATRARARTKNLEVKLDFSTKPVVEIDSVRIAQVLNNLFSNAAKYAPGATISISLSRQSDYYRICFADNGPGIPPEHLPHIFKRFFRVPGLSGSGSGLGLFISEKIIDAHGGRLSVESELGAGTTFLIDLPADSASSPEGE